MPSRFARARTASSSGSGRRRLTALSFFLNSNGTVLKAEKSYSLKLDDLLRAEKQALMDSGRGFAFVVGFGTVYGTNMRIDHEYVVIPRADCLLALHDEVLPGMTNPVCTKRWDAGSAVGVSRVVHRLS